MVAGYPWFGTWSRDTMISYEGLFLATGYVVPFDPELFKAIAFGTTRTRRSSTPPAT